jgi:hypothetical protein
MAVSVVSSGASSADTRALGDQGVFISALCTRKRKPDRPARGEEAFVFRAGVFLRKSLYPKGKPWDGL